MINGGGASYTVEEASELLGIPRPTLYRYLREYSIPHVRRGGRISIPEESFDKIRRARDLHKEGLGTELVRRMLREEERAPDPEELARRLDRVSRELEGLRGAPLDDPALNQALRTILARQSLLMSAVFNLTDMTEELLRRSGQPPRSEAWLQEAEVPLPPRAGRPAFPPPRRGVPGAPRRSLPPAVEAKSFGRLARRRRRAALAALLAVLAAVAAAALVLAGGWVPGL
ncbi:Excisionase/Xis, DNA-binding protein [Rubrobacter xylanophilus DSM 9941]|uniref:Excisionase/Xis, DNA-binding protein n=1 Tax=Rubrobacter xylanophilus (strain DSM 9941 / JCM 11954 / NBRC 16129 / PRD-1) TaxID=266117 RepID=Q1AXE1_RUBXD|nr:helix-turn-helix domain-containing protein [Rubrobacter xylanophilus]ABG03937.1 Excisionase/Xis, DNA-binding protein [Rubrobacter xylanophilus DSM 9941]